MKPIDSSVRKPTTRVDVPPNVAKLAKAGVRFTSFVAEPMIGSPPKLAAMRATVEAVGNQMRQAIEGELAQPEYAALVDRNDLPCLFGIHDGTKFGRGWHAHVCIVRDAFDVAEEGFASAGWRVLERIPRYKAMGAAGSVPSAGTSRRASGRGSASSATGRRRIGGGVLGLGPELGRSGGLGDYAPHVHRVGWAGFLSIAPRPQWAWLVIGAAPKLVAEQLRKHGEAAQVSRLKTRLDELSA